MTSDEVIVHARDHSEAGAVGVGGRHALKTYRRQDTKFKPLIFSAVAGFVLLAVLVAIVIRTSGTPPHILLLALAAAALGPPCAWAGYTFLRDAELEPYKGKSLAIRTVICGLIFALMWGVYWFVGTQWGGPDAFAKGLEIYQLVVLGAIPLGIGTFASFVSLDLEPINAFLHCAMYFAVTVLLRWVADMQLLPGLIFGS
jgi:hypothetical protein